jgi:ligand-binding SRPBCC domain-containing protein
VRYRHVFQVAAPARQVTEFHRRAQSLAAITPPPIVVRVHQAPEVLAEGDVIRFTLWLGPLPVNWTARIEEVTAQGFIDRQLDGPFKRWAHRHTFVSEGEGKTLVIDEIDYEFKRHPLWLLVGSGMAFGLPGLFLYRGWKTRRLVEGGS